MPGRPESPPTLAAPPGESPAGGCLRGHSDLSALRLTCWLPELAAGTLVT